LIKLPNLSGQMCFYCRVCGARKTEWEADLLTRNINTDFVPWFIVTPFQLPCLCTMHAHILARARAGTHSYVA